MFEEYLSQRILDNRPVDKMAKISAKEKDKMVEDILGVFSRKSENAQQRPELNKRNDAEMREKIFKLRTSITTSDIDITLKKTAREQKKVNDIYKQAAKEQTVDQLSEKTGPKISSRLQEREKFLNHYK